MANGIQVVGLKELNRAVRQASDRELGRRMGQANKQIGRLVISKLTPRPVAAAVGEGGGSTVRPSASKREVVLRVGGAHRAKSSSGRGVSDGEVVKMRQWGRRGVNLFRPSPPRPHIIGTVEKYRSEIYGEWRKAVSSAFRGVFWRVG